jgi:hypothetical protein
MSSADKKQRTDRDHTAHRHNGLPVAPQGRAAFEANAIAGNY